ncbi:Serine protease inhibitor 77Ba [Eumeta japonica]|uniref:Serine protease inhibitor 77Ba n=1 Tax=Eumeta variegata TaxID=151549 RepID=A0A4C1Z3B3_EUMVA|nr:Serine protease inhibitor 77Ba [Eumeta japonica]
MRKKPGLTLILWKMVVFAKAIRFALALSAVTVCYCLQLSDDCRNFSHKIINVTDVTLVKRDTVLAPFAIWNLLFTLALAASGETSRQLLSALRLSHEKENKIIKANKDLNREVIQTGNAGVSYTSGTYIFWDIELQVNAEFKAIINYGLEIENEVLDFANSTAAVVKANSAIVNSIQNLLRGEDFATSRMIVLSPTVFEGHWTLPFNAIDTTIEPFYSENGEIIRQVYMMNQRNRFPFTNIRELGAFVLQLPYGSNDKYCMLILLPWLGTTVSEVYQNLVSSFTLKEVFYKLNNDTKTYGLENIDIKIPRFEIITNSDSHRLLNSMGVYDIFDSIAANFSRTTSESIFVSSIKRSASISVTESGTSASASATAMLTDKIVLSTPISGTALHRTIKSDPVYSAGFIANRPFIYYVMEKKTTTILFGGAFSEFVVF